MTDTRSAGFVEISVPRAYEEYMTRQLFEPWARELVRRAAPRRGASLLDVATGPGAVARLGAAEAGAEGRVVAADISPAMLAIAAARAPLPGSAPIELLECPADALGCAEASFELVLCQHGLQFFPDPLAALREMHRVLAPAGVALVSTWAAERPLGLFGPIVEALRDAGVPEPYPRAFDAGSYCIGRSDLRRLLQTAGFDDVTVETVELECTWETGDEAVAVMLGTPFGPIVAALPLEQQEGIRAGLRERLGCRAEGELRVTTASTIARGAKPID